MGGRDVRSFFLSLRTAVARLWLVCCPPPPLHRALCVFPAHPTLESLLWTLSTELCSEKLADKQTAADHRKWYRLTLTAEHAYLLARYDSARLNWSKTPFSFFPPHRPFSFPGHGFQFLDALSSYPFPRRHSLLEKSKLTWHYLRLLMGVIKTERQAKPYPSPLAGDNKCNKLEFKKKRRDDYNTARNKNNGHQKLLIRRPQASSVTNVLVNNSSQSPCAVLCCWWNQFF